MHVVRDVYRFYRFCSYKQNYNKLSYELLVQVSEDSIKYSAIFIKFKNEQNF